LLNDANGILIKPGENTQAAALVEAVVVYHVHKNQMRANKACTGQVGTVRLLEHFSGFEFFLLPSRVSVPPTSGYRLLAVSRLGIGSILNRAFEDLHGCESSRFFIFRLGFLSQGMLRPPPRRLISINSIQGFRAGG